MSILRTERMAVSHMTTRQATSQLNWLNGQATRHLVTPKYGLINLFSSTYISINLCFFFYFYGFSMANYLCFHSNDTNSLLIQLHSTMTQTTAPFPRARVLVHCCSQFMKLTLTGIWDLYFLGSWQMNPPRPAVSRCVVHQDAIQRQWFVTWNWRKHSACD